MAGVNNHGIWAQAYACYPSGLPVALVSWIAPYECYILHLHVGVSKYVGVGEYIVYTVYLDGVATDLTVTIEHGYKKSSNLKDRVRVNKGQSVQLVEEPSNNGSFTGPYVYLTAEIVPLNAV